MTPIQPTQTNPHNSEDKMNDSEITYRVDQLIDLGKASAIRGWSMENILKIIQNEFGPEGYEIARTYIVRDISGIPDEEAYIDNAIKKVRKEKAMGSASDKMLEELEKDTSEE
jgi:hypothetical protein